MKVVALTRDIDCDVNTPTRSSAGIQSRAGTRPANHGREPLLHHTLGLQAGWRATQPPSLFFGSGRRASAPSSTVTGHRTWPAARRDQARCQWPPYTGNKFDNFPDDCPWGDDMPGRSSIFRSWRRSMTGICLTVSSPGQPTRWPRSSSFHQRFFTNSPYQCPDRRWVAVPKGAKLTAPRQQLDAHVHVQVGRRREPRTASRHQFSS